MKTSLNTLDGLKRSLTVELPVDTFNDKTEKIIKSLATKVRIDGFRKGKIPANILRHSFGASAKSDAATEMVSETLQDALKDADVVPAAQPSLTNVDTENSESLIYTIEFEVYPEIKLNALSSLKIDQVTSKVTEEDEERALQDLQDRSTEYKSDKSKSCGERFSDACVHYLWLTMLKKSINFCMLVASCEMSSEWSPPSISTYRGCIPRSSIPATHVRVAKTGTRSS